MVTHAVTCYPLRELVKALSFSFLLPAFLKHSTGHQPVVGSGYRKGGTVILHSAHVVTY